MSPSDPPPVSSVSPVTFPPGDPSNPRNFSPLRKWTIVTAITLIDLSVSWGASGYSPATKNFTSDFGVSSEVGTLGLSVYVAGLALGPMLLAPLSEYYGRTPLYILPYGTYLALVAGTATVPTGAVGGFLALRFFSGFFAAVTIANFGGTIADLWPRDKVGPAMSVFQWAGVCGSPMGYFLFSFVAGTRPWREVFWAILGCSGGLWLIMLVVLVGFGNETRHSVLLRRRAKRMQKERGGGGVELPPEMQEESVVQLFRVTLSRPFRFLLAEPIVIFAALYNGYLYGLSFLFNGAFTLVFGPKGYGFTTIGVGLAFLGFIIGVSLGPIVNVLQERHYQSAIRAVEKTNSGTATPTGSEAPLEPGHAPAESVDRYPNLPEARVQLSKIAGLTFPVSLFWFAWVIVPSYHIHWIVPILATTLFGWSFYTLILMTYVYVEDSYMVYSASALAGVALIRNLFGAGFPLFGEQMFVNLGYNWAGTILAFLALLLAPIPFILERYGPKLRAKSPYARQHIDETEGGA